VSDGDRRAAAAGVARCDRWSQCTRSGGGGGRGGRSAPAARRARRGPAGPTSARVGRLEASLPALVEAEQRPRSARPGAAKPASASICGLGRLSALRTDLEVRAGGIDEQPSPADPPPRGGRQPPGPPSPKSGSPPRPGGRARPSSPRPLTRCTRCVCACVRARGRADRAARAPPPPVGAARAGDAAPRRAAQDARRPRPCWARRAIACSAPTSTTPRCGCGWRTPPSSCAASSTAIRRWPWRRRVRAARRSSAAARVRDLERDLRLLGPINPLALEEHTALQSATTLIEAQLEDVKASRRELAKLIRAIATRS